MSRQFVAASSQGVRFSPSFSDYTLSVSFWMKPNSIINNYCPLALSDSTGARCYLLIQNVAGGNRLLSVSGAGAYSVRNDTAAGIVSVGSWYHVAVGFNGVNGDAFHWLNNVQADTSVGAQTASGNYTSISIGAIYVPILDTWSNFFDGIIADVSFYTSGSASAMLTNEIVDSLFKAGPPETAFGKPSSVILAEKFPLAGNLSSIVGAQLTNNGSTSSNDHPRLYL